MTDRPTRDGSTLPDGEYPFVDERLPLSEMAMVEAPPALQALLQSQAVARGVEILRDEPVELRCVSEALEATFLVFWPSGEAAMHMLVPKTKARGLA